MCSSPPDTGHKTQLPESPLPYSGDVLEVITPGAFTIHLTRPVIVILLFCLFHELECILQQQKKQRRSPIIKYFSLMK